VTAAARPTAPDTARGRGPNGLALATGFLTRIPVPARAGATAALAPGALGRAAVWFPVVGALVGAVLGATRLLADLVLPPGPATALAVGAAIAVTGALHEDGLADTADGLGAHRAPERRLEIMRDPRVGTFGAVALVLALLLTWSLLSGLDGRDCLVAAVAAHALARWAMLVGATAFPPARAPGAGAGTLLTVTRTRLAAATLVATAIAVAAAGPVPGAIAVGSALLATAALGAAATRALGGVTGDVYGATGKAVEIAAIATLVAAWN
jgi:adenosylcobinamide-GDP ribazoletransferase